MHRSIVITGSTRGIGLGLAAEFLKRGQNVCISGQSRESVDNALATLQPLAHAGKATVIGTPCKVEDLGQVQALWNTARTAFGNVDIWINNAGISNAKRPFAMAEFEDISKVITTNVVGTMTGSRIALAEMSAQGSGSLYNVEGFGSEGRTAPGLAIYGTSKSAVSYFTKALIRETKDSDIGVGYLSPGIVVTDLLLRDKEAMPPRHGPGSKELTIFSPTMWRPSHPGWRTRYWLPANMEPASPG